ncbi:MAG: SIS domain-containing protein, partial [Eubacterium sp.]
MDSKEKIFIKKKKNSKPVLPQADKGSFPDFMRKEIFTQPQLINEFLSRYIKAGRINFDCLKIKIEKIKRAYIVGGSADYGCVLAGAYNFEVLVDIPCAPALISEFNFSNPILDKSTLVIVICADKNNELCKTALNRIKESGAKAIGIFNFEPESSFSVSLNITENSTVSTAGYTL